MRCIGRGSVVAAVVLASGCAEAVDESPRALGTEPPTGAVTLVAVDLAQDDARLFGELASAVLTPDGRVALLDQQAQEIVLLDGPDSSFILAEEGEGPGEISSARGLGVFGAAIVAFEASGLVQVIELDGTVTGRHYVPGLDPRLSTAGRTAIFAARLSGGYLRERETPWRLSGNVPYSMGPHHEAAESLHVHELVRDSTGALSSTDTLSIGVFQVPRVTIDAGGGKTQLGLDYTPRAWAAVSPDGVLLTGSTGTDSLMAVGAGQRTVIRIDRDPVEVPEDLAHELEGPFRVLRERGRDFEVEGWRRPTQKPLYHSVVLGREGVAWVRLHPPSERTPTPDSTGGPWLEAMSVFDEFDLDSGLLEATWVGPPNVRITWVGHGCVLGISIDDLDVTRPVALLGEHDDPDSTCAAFAERWRLQRP